MKVGCFALIEPFSSLDHQLQIIEDLGFKYADVTDSHSGGSLIDTIGMTASVSLDSNPIALKRLFEKHGITEPLSARMPNYWIRQIHPNMV